MKNNYLHVIICVFLLHSCVRQEPNLYRIAVNDLFGYIDVQGIVRIDPRFTYASEFHEGFAYARIDSMIGYINKDGKYKHFVTVQMKKQTKIKIDSTGHLSYDTISIIDPPITEQNPFNNLTLSELASINLDEYLLKPSESDVSFSEGLAMFYDPVSSKFGYINKRGKFIIGPRFSNGGKFVNDVARVQIDRKTGFIKRDGTFLIEPQFRSATDFSDGLAIAVNVHNDTLEDGSTSTSSNSIVLNPIGQIVQTPQGYLFINQFHNGNALITDPIRLVVGKNYKRFINEKLQPQTEEYFEDAKDFSEHLAGIKINGRWGFINSSFNHFIDIKYDDVQSFNEGLAPVKIRQHWGYIDRDGNVVIDFQYERCTPFKNGLAYVWLNNNGFKTEGYINKSAYLVWSKATE